MQGQHDQQTHAGSRGSNLRGNEEIIQKASDPSHPLHELYKKGNVTFQSETKAQLQIGEISVKNRPGVYNFTVEGNQVSVVGTSPANSKILVEDYPDMKSAIEASEAHYEKRKPISKKKNDFMRLHPETSPLAPDRKGKLGRPKR